MPKKIVPGSTDPIKNAMVAAVAALLLPHVDSMSSKLRAKRTKAVAAQCAPCRLAMLWAVALVEERPLTRRQIASLGGVAADSSRHALRLLTTMRILVLHPDEDYAYRANASLVPDDLEGFRLRITRRGDGREVYL